MCGPIKKLGCLLDLVVQNGVSEPTILPEDCYGSGNIFHVYAFCKISYIDNKKGHCPST